MDKGRLKGLYFAAAVLALLVFPGRIPAEVKVNISVELPKVVLPSAPNVFVIPGTYIYLADSDAEILFFHGHWYRPHKGRWFRADDYNGPWISVAVVPEELKGLPPGYRNIPPGHERIPWGQLKREWKGWEKHRRWDGHGKAKMEREHRKEHKDKGRHRD